MLPLPRIDSCARAAPESSNTGARRSSVTSARLEQFGDPIELETVMAQFDKRMDDALAKMSQTTNCAGRERLMRDCKEVQPP